ncbi:MAG TPA: MBL fold metallo-hydrolase [Streptosporangiaceae bacterium]|nr:MBL fold metallo-hydrolase [Streptosporangiaceae bacterium]
MTDQIAFPTPRDQPRDLDAYALSGSFAVGGLTVHHVSDGLTFGNRRYWFNGIDPAAWMPPLGLIDPDTPFPVNFGLFVVIGGGAVTLVDCGFGPAIGELSGVRGGNQLLTRLAEIGIAPEQVDSIVLTHLHTDHCGQLVTELPGGEVRVTFPNASVHIQADELAYWTGTAADDNPMSPYVRSRIMPVAAADQVRTFGATAPVAPGVEAIAMPGHTAGHTVVRVSADGATCFLVGDLAHHPVHFCYHSWLPAIDADPPRSVRAREDLAQLAIAQDAVVTAPHMPILTLGRLARNSGGQITWRRVEPER